MPHHARGGRPSPAADCPLTGDELDTVIYAASGYSIVTQALLTGSSGRAVQRCRLSALAALRAVSVAHAVAICMANRWILPADILPVQAVDHRVPARAPYGRSAVSE